MDALSSMVRIYLLCDTQRESDRWRSLGSLISKPDDEVSILDGHIHTYRRVDIQNKA